ncbi:hypothetical protein PF006_g25939 [Phytophthora fragariae]|uniref:Ubiquitin-like protease family profile domain-containing protein n=1 Tax=Phytophthora fragariae TaxID=53985 RepID=A0A6A3R090_9STRA|nr:hypothetical protein PF006_g25939 [Phytophthora fragariae]
MSKAIYSGRHAVDVDRVEDSVDMMMKARNQEEYDRGLRYMYYILDGFDDTGDLPEPKHPLLDYFVRNWHSCKEMWAVYERGHVAHLGNHTNNRLESAWGALKDILNPEMELDECVETLYFLQSTAELEYASRFNVLGSRIYHGADEMLLRLAVLVSPHAFELIRKEYELFKNGSLSYEGRWIQDKIVHMRSHATGGEYTVNTSTFVCSCFFMRTMLLPWHHAMFVRSSMNKKKVIPIIYIHARWLLQSEVNRPEEDESDDDISCAAFRVQASHMRSVEHAVLNGSSKWKTGMDIAAGVVEAMCSQGTPTFVKMAEALRGFGECARRGAVPIISVDPPCSERAVERVVEVTSEEDRPEVQNQMPDNDDTDVILTDTSTVPPTLKTTQTSDSVCMSDHNSDVVEDFAVEVEIEATTSYSASVHAADEDDGGGDIAADIRSLIAETERIINRANEMVSSDGERSDSQSKLPDRTKKTYNLATKARVNRKELPVKAVVKEKKRSQSESDTNQSGSDTNQLGSGTNQSGKNPAQLVLRKRRTKSRTDSEDESCEGNSNPEDITGRFFVSTAVKSKGRPKIRRKQTREAKKIRMEGSVAEANALVQGTLIPVKDLALVRKTMSRSFNVADALPVLNSIEQVDAPSWKSTTILLLARKQKVHRKVTIVFPKNYVSKCIAGIATYRKSLPSDHNAGRMGVSIEKLGTFAEEDLITMLEWNDESPKVMAVNDLAEWIRVSRFTRISLPSPLNNCATVDMQACAKRLENVGLKTSISTRFGPVSVHELAFFRRSEWLDDSCVKLVMNHLIDQDLDEQGLSRIGGVNPLYARVHDEAMKHQVIANSPFQADDRLVLVPVYLEAHWAGVVFDYHHGKAVMFDPMQKLANYKDICKILDKYFGEYVEDLEPIRQRAPCQEDTNSCGPLTLFFFECMVRGIPVPRVSKEQVAYLRFRYLFLTSKGVFCRSPELATTEN